MYRKRIILDRTSDATTILSQVQAECGAAGLSLQDVETVVSSLRGPIETLIDSGNAVASSGGQFRADRRITTDTADVTIGARYGAPLGVFARLCRALTGGA
jgi:hypothetical protein